MRWKSEQYRAMGEWNRFADPRVVELLQQLHGTDAEHCSGTLSVLWAGDQRAAVHFGIRSPRTLSWWFPAYNPALGRYSPGMQLLLHLVEAAGEYGLSRINLGAGEHGYYKDAMKTGDVVVARGTVDDGSPAALLLRAARAPRYHLRPLVTDSSRLQALTRRLRRPDSRRFRD
jgi:CelD/BcsL family acetyltransferase involved in cellulose biosynthesis